VRQKEMELREKNQAREVRAKNNEIAGRSQAIEEYEQRQREIREKERAKEADRQRGIRDRELML
jgi:hypothetical protein